MRKQFLRTRKITVRQIDGATACINVDLKHGKLELCVLDGSSTTAIKGGKMPETYAVPMLTNSGAATQNMLSVRNLQKIFGGRDVQTKALDGVSFDVEKGEFVAIMGPSGSGKTTLLNCISTIDRATRGQIAVDGRDITTLSRKALSRFRRDSLGFIFQDFNLLDTLTGYENIALALTIKHTSPAQIPTLVKNIALSLGVKEVLQKYPYQMSGGQKQRVAAARAMVADPKLVLADEPTGALDSRSANVLLEVLEVMNMHMGATILMVTHDAYAASFTRRVLFLKDGRVFNELRRGNDTREQFFASIMDVVSFLSGGVEVLENAHSQGEQGGEVLVEAQGGQSKEVLVNAQGGQSNDA